MSTMAVMTKTQVGAAGRLLREMVAARRDSAGPERGGALRVVERARPARSVAAKVAAAGGVDDETAALLRELTGRHLGADVDRWCGLYDALGGHRGGLPELLAAPPVAPGSGDTLRPPRPAASTTRSVCSWSTRRRSMPPPRSPPCPSE